MLQKSIMSHFSDKMIYPIYDIVALDVAGAVSGGVAMSKSKKLDATQILRALKVSQLREQRGLSIRELGRRANVSSSHLSDIEQGLRPLDNLHMIEALEDALHVEHDFISSRKLDESALMIINFINFTILNQIEISPGEVIQFFKCAPGLMDAIRNALRDIAASYGLGMGEASLNRALLRSYQESRHNYFEEIEESVERFIEEFPVKGDVKYEDFRKYETLVHKRSIKIQDDKPLLIINQNLFPNQQAFEIGRELGFNYLRLKERDIASPETQSRSFAQLWNETQASYFSGALLINRYALKDELNTLLQKAKFDRRHFFQIMESFSITPEMLLHRTTNLIYKEFGLQKFHFIRFDARKIDDQWKYDLTKKYLNISSLLLFDESLKEHYCRRWGAIKSLKWFADHEPTIGNAGTYLHVHRSHSIGNKEPVEEHVCISMARRRSLRTDVISSVTLGIFVDDQARETIRFLADEDIQVERIGSTCERCLATAEECGNDTRAAEPHIAIKKRLEEEIDTDIKRIRQTFRAHA
jgi:transcriptional regulator with XRE-family HTH domain